VGAVEAAPPPADTRRLKPGPISSHTLMEILMPPNARHSLIAIAILLGCGGHVPAARAQSTLDSLFASITVTDVSGFPEIVIYTTLRDARGRIAFDHRLHVRLDRRMDRTAEHQARRHELRQQSGDVPKEKLQGTPLVRADLGVADVVAAGQLEGDVGRIAELGFV